MGQVGSVCTAKRRDSSNVGTSDHHESLHDALSKDKVTHLEAKNMHDDILKGMADDLEVADKVKKVTLGLSEVTDEGMIAFINCVREHGFVKELALSFDKGTDGITAETFSAMNTLLLQNRFIKSLSLACPGRGSEIMGVLEPGLKKNRDLTSFSITDSNLNDDDAMRFNDILQANATITKLDISRNEITDDGVTTIAEGWALNLSLAVLNLTGNEGVTIKSHETLEKIVAQRAKRGKKGIFHIKP